MDGRMSFRPSFVLCCAIPYVYAMRLQEKTAA